MTSVIVHRRENGKLKRIEKRLEAAESWIKEFEKNTGPEQFWII